MEKRPAKGGSLFDKTWFNALLAICIVGVIASFACPGVFHENPHSRGCVTCINNLRQIDGAVNEWALEKNKTTNDTPTWDDIKPYIKLDAAGNIPKCPGGGVYTLWKVGAIQQVTCSLSASVPPHRLP